MKTKTWTIHYSLQTVLLLALCCFALSPAPKAFGVSPPPDGGYPGGNTAEGQNALSSLTSGLKNTADGYFALFLNTSGRYNTASGSLALYSNTTGSNNTALGASALYHNTTGSGNVAIGAFALQDNTTGSNNIAIGNGALQYFNGDGITVIGNAFFSDGSSVTIGRGSMLNGNCSIGPPGIPNASIIADNDVSVGYISAPYLCRDFPIGTATVHIRALTAVYVGAVSGNPVSGSPVTIGSDGQLGVAPSSERFKDEIKPMDKASEAILALKPVTFHYKHELDPDGVPQFGLVAEQVEKVNADLVVRDAEGKVFTVRYEAVNAMLLNEFLKEHRTVQELKLTAAKQEATIVQLKQDFQSKLAEQQKEIKALASGLEKINNQLELTKPAPQMVAKNQ